MDVMITFIFILIPSIAIEHIIIEKNNDSTVTIADIIPTINMGIIIILYFAGIAINLNVALTLVIGLLLIVSVWGGYKEL